MFKMNRRETRLFETATGQKVQLSEMFKKAPRVAPGVAPGKFSVFTYGENPELVETFDTFQDAIDWVQAHDWESKAGYIVLGQNGQGFGSDKAEAFMYAQDEKALDAIGLPKRHDGHEVAFPESRKERSKQLLSAVLEGTKSRKVLAKRIPLKQKTYLNPKMAADQAKLERQKPRDKAPDKKHAKMTPGAPKIAPEPSKGKKPVSYKGK